MNQICRDQKCCIHKLTFSDCRNKERFGDLEIDALLPNKENGHKPNQKCDSGTIEFLEHFKDHVHTITADNGREFTNNSEDSQTLDAKVYFTHPYGSWEREANENNNRLLT